jgi:hypothetical protein
MTQDMDRAYERFLSSSDLETWTGCAEAYRDVLDAADLRDARPADLLRALTIALYVAWLAVRCGRSARRDRMMSAIRAVGARVERLAPGTHDRRDATLIRAVLAAAHGYQATARALVEDLGRLPVEVALLTAPSRATPKAAMLTPYVLDGAGCRFVPALYFYGSALLDLGYQSRARDLLERYPGAAPSALARDLRGQLLELAGSWQDARDAYADSEWAAHTYRGAVCDLILGESLDRLAAWPAETVEKFVAGMLDFQGETDRAGVVRSASFVRACRWSGFDSWLVHFELGRLGFQRRHHAEAERHFAAAARAAPEPYRFAIRSLRFTNLTWLGTAMDADTDPEAREAGHAALEEPASEDQRAHIRTWLGRFDGEAAVLEPVLSSSDDYERGNAHHLRGSVPEALACWSSCLAAYTPRAYFDLLRAFASCGFENTASRLAAIVARESADSFFDLWELAGAIAGVLDGQPPARAAGGLLGKQLTGVEARMEELVGSEFQNAIRAFRYFLGRRRPAPARRMLARAERLAEGSEELLLLAIARRTATAGGWDPRTLDALERAQRQSKDRFERLVIARELVALGELSRARAILREEDVLSTKLDLTAIEYVLALQCAKLCFDDDERARLAAAAVDALQRDLGAGRFAHHAHLYLERLKRNLEAPLEIAAPAHTPGADVAGVADSAWRTLTRELDRLQQERRSEQELRLLNDKLDALADDGSPFARLALWGLHLDRFDAQIRLIHRLRPTVADDETPLARDSSPVRTRSRVLAQLWRAHLGASHPDQAERLLGKILGFLAEERRLTERWDRLRAVEAEDPTYNALRYARQGAMLLEDIGAEDQRTPWPSFLELREPLSADARQLAARLEERAASVHRQAPGAPGAPGASGAPGGSGAEA